MNCQEVMEYMQRELDGDLGEFESEKMREHIRQCADCAAMYERLNRLSAELENLPKVTPPFSLVDAILPKLDEIDRVRTAVGADAGAAELADPAGNAPRTAPRRRNSRFNLRILGGVVAAGIVAGIFIVTNNQERLNDSFSGNSAGMESAASVSSGSTMLMMDAANEVADAGDLSDPLLQKSLGFGSVEDQAFWQAAESQAGSARDPVIPDQVDDGGVNTGSGSLLVTGSSSGSSASSDSGGSNAGSGSAADDHRMSPPDMLQGDTDMIGVAEWEEAPVIGPEDGTQMGITGFFKEPPVDQVESESPDGSWTAVFADSRVIIRDRDGNTRFESEERKGAIAAMGWSDDGAYFRYEVRLEDGASEIYRIEPAAGTETKE